MGTLAALIFDVDGTLAETEEWHRAAFNAAFAAAGLEWQWDQALYARLLAVTGGKERIRHYIEAHGGQPALAADAIAALHRDKTARYTALLEGPLALRPGVAALMAEAHQAGIKLAIATTTSRPNVDALLAAAAPVPPIDAIAAGDEVPHKKPAPDIYHLALRKLALPAGACLAIEDTENGLASAQAAGIPCLVTRSFYGGPGPFPGAVATVDDLAKVGLREIAALLG